MPATATATAEPYGVVAIRGNAVGIALDQLREVVPAPERYLPLPTAAPGLLGAIDLRGLLVPVIELDIAGTAEGTAPIIAVLHIGAGLLGLAADRVLGVERVDPSRLQPLRTAGADDCLFPCCYHDPGGHGVVSLLDGEALIERSGVPAPSTWRCGRRRATSATAPPRTTGCARCCSPPSAGTTSPSTCR
ncbi:MAG: chemotaxis protein CheW [Acidimicrobiales bacterium]